MLVKLSRLLPLASAPEELLPALAESAVDDLGASGAVMSIAMAVLVWLSQWDSYLLSGRDA